MIYDVYSVEAYVGTFETNESIQTIYDVLCAVFEQDKLTFKSRSFRHTFYVYKYKEQGIVCLGSFETDLSMLEVFDYVFQVFNEGSDTGVFLREEILV